VPWCLPFSSDGFHCGVDGPATLVTEHENQSGSQNLNTVLDASQAFIVEHIARDSDDEEISESFIKDEFRWHPRIGTTEYDRERVLTFRQFSPSFGGLLAGHAQRNYVRIFIAVFSYVRSLITCLVRVLYVSSYETAIAFLESRKCVGGRHHWSITVRWLSSAGKLACDKKTDNDGAGYKLGLSHAGDLNKTSRAQSIRKGGEHQRAAKKYNTKETIKTMATIHQRVLSPAGFACDPNCCLTKSS
jgi:hypothetical protein